MKRLLMISVITLISFNFIWGQQYKIVYSNGFEEGDAGCNLDIVSYYMNLGCEFYGAGLNIILGNYFYKGASYAYEGNKSLYFSEDGGNTNIWERPPSISDGNMSLVELTLPSLSAGNYKISFAYIKTNSFGKFFIVEDKTCEGLFNSNISNSSIEDNTSENWSVVEFSFTIPEGRTANYIYFTAINLGLFAMGGGIIHGITIDNIVIKKEFIPYNITVNTDGHGTIEASQNINCTDCVTENGYLAEAGEVVTLNIIPDAGYILDSYTVQTNSGESVTITNNQFIMPAEDVIITATFAIAPIYSVTVIDGFADKSEACCGETVNITANTAPTDQEFDKWLTDDEVTFADENSPITSFVMINNDVTVTATYKTLSITNVTQSADFYIHPVPASDIVNVVRTSACKALIEIYNSNGDLLQSLETGKIETEINVSLLTAGVYFVKVTEEKNVSIQKVVIKN